MSIGALLKAWPLIVVAGGGLLGYGVLRSDVSYLKTEQLTARQDHDAIVRIETEQKAIVKSVEEIKSDVKEIATAIRESR